MSRLLLPISSPSAPAADPVPAPPRLAPGVELVGEYPDSGFVEPPWLLRRGDGQVVQLSRLLYLVAEAADGVRGLDEMAEHVTSAFGRGVSAANVAFLIDERLAPAGIVATEAAAPGPAPAPPRASPLLGLRFRFRVMPARAVRAVAAALRPLFLPPVVVVALAALAALDVWAFAVHGLWRGTVELILHPGLLVPMGALLVLSVAFHECGHAAGCAYAGARPGAMGAGLYIVAPVFYTDVTDAYRLGRAGRLRTDLGGVYFNALFCLAVGAAYFGTGFEPLLVVVLSQHIVILQQLVPWLRMDGYYVVSDLVGVPDAFSLIGPVVRSVLPRRADARAAALTPRARRSLLAYFATIAPVLVGTIVLMGLYAPDAVTASWESFRRHLDATTDAIGAGSAWTAALEALQVLILGAPALALALTLGLCTNRAVRHVRRRPPAPAAESPAARPSAGAQ